MKKIIGAIGIFGLLLTGCSDISGGEEVKTVSRFERIYEDDEYEFEIVQDKETSCKYISYLDYHYESGGFTPLLKSDGTPDCTK